MITAKEAKKLADGLNERLVTIEINRIMEGIKRQAENGCYAVTIDKLSSQVKSYLESHGYKVRYFGDQRDGTDEYQISWS